jgi:chromosome segregation ATPase
MVFSAVTAPTISRHLLLALLLGLCAQSASAAPQVYYRYVDENGVSVLDHSIPPEYAQKGYEIVKVTGEVVKTVAPASAADVEAQARKQALLETRKDYERLSRRYSSLAEIESAKQRKLANLDTNIAILKGNITGLESQIIHIRAQAADVERAGREVPEAHLQKLADTRAELAGAKELLATREKEYNVVAARFDEDMVVYAAGRKLLLGGAE